jgi:mono/diheme cytochrome c family protein
MVLLAAAILTELAPANGPLPVDVASRPVTIDQRVTTGDLDVWLLARLTGAANDRYTITVSDAAGHVPADLQRVIVETHTTTGGAETGDRFDAEPLSGSPGTFVFPALQLGLPGVWKLDVIVRRAGLEDAIATLTLDTTGTGAQPPRLSEDAWRLPRPTLPAWLFGLASIVSLIGGLILVRRLRGLEPFAAAILLTMTALITAGFAVQGYRQTIPVSAGTDLDNPVSADAGAVQRAEGLYRELCLQCHGEGGLGVATDDPEHTHAGSNLLDPRTQNQRDGDLYWAITNGVAGTEMPAYDAALTDQERWELVAYLRSLDDAPATPEPDS